MDSEGKKALLKLIVPLVLYGAYAFYIFRKEKRKTAAIYQVEDFLVDIGLD